MFNNYLFYLIVGFSIMAVSLIAFVHFIFDETTLYSIPNKIIISSTIVIFIFGTLYVIQNTKKLFPEEKNFKVIINGIEFNTDSFEKYNDIITFTDEFGIEHKLNGLKEKSADIKIYDTKSSKFSYKHLSLDELQFSNN